MALFLPDKLPTRDEMLADEPLKDFFVFWDDAKMKDAHAFNKCLQHSENENDIQRFLTQNPIILVQHLGGGHGRWVIPKQRLGAEYQTDYIIGEQHSGGFEWFAVELESPKAPMFSQSGRPSKHLAQAIRQIQDWRAWLVKNQNYAARSIIDSGLGLTDIRPDLKGLILIGRRNNLRQKNKELRQQISVENNIEIHTYDYLLESTKTRVQALKKWKNKN